MKQALWAISLQSSNRTPRIVSIIVSIIPRSVPASPEVVHGLMKTVFIPNKEKQNTIARNDGEEYDKERKRDPVVNCF